MVRETHSLLPALIRHFPYGLSLKTNQARNVAHSNMLRPPTVSSALGFFLMFLPAALTSGFPTREAWPPRPVGGLRHRSRADFHPESKAFPNAAEFCASIRQTTAGGIASRAMRLRIAANTFRAPGALNHGARACGSVGILSIKD